MPENLVVPDEAANPSEEDPVLVTKAAFAVSLPASHTPTKRWVSKWRW
jgi:hypothetical protein